MADMPEPDKNKGDDLCVYADDVPLMAQDEKIHIAEQNAQTYLDKTIDWIDKNNLLLADKTQAAILTPDPAEYDRKLNLKKKENY